MFQSTSYSVASALKVLYQNVANATHNTEHGTVVHILYHLMTLPLTLLQSVDCTDTIIAKKDEYDRSEVLRHSMLSVVPE